MAGKEENLPWVEKYRPKTIGEIAHQEEVVATLQKAVSAGGKKGELPHLLLYGPPGTGKTSTALALVRDLFGAANVKSRVLELNASDERGIKVVRDKIKQFAQATVSRISGGDGEHPCPPFKVVILDEADAITYDAQTALRRTMEAHATVTRFILICNYVSKIIAPLTSRCAKFRFNALPVSAMVGHLRKIADSESVVVNDEVLEGLVKYCDGDLRKAITTLQSAHRMGNGGVLDESCVAEVACLVPKDVVDEFDTVTSATKRSHAEVRNCVDNVVHEGYSMAQLMNQYSARLLNTGSEGVAAMSSSQKAMVAMILAEAEHRLIDATDEKIQMYNVASRISKVAKLSNNLDGLLSA